MIRGIDVSFYQGTSIDWNKVKNSNIEFVIIKSSEGNGRLEPRALLQAKGASSADLKIGYYHFSHPGEGSAIRDASEFKEALSKLPKADIIPTLDIEVNKTNLSPQSLTQWIVDFVIEMRKDYRDIILYSYKPFLDSFLLPNQTLASCPLWIAQYTSQSSPQLPKGWSNFTIWQYSQTGKIEGIEGNVDLNIANSLPLM